MQVVLLYATWYLSPVNPGFAYLVERESRLNVQTFCKTSESADSTFDGACTYIGHIRYLLNYIYLTAIVIFQIHILH